MTHYSNGIKTNSGFTLVEMLIAMFLFVIIMAVASQAFNQIISTASQWTKREETSIEGAIGLEMFRHDLEQMGFGLPWGWSVRNADGDLSDSQIKYYESGDTTGKLLNDSDNSGTATSGAIPRAFVGLAGIGAFSSDYIALKGTTVGRDQASQRWASIPFNNISTSTGYLSQPATQTFSDPLQAGDTVIAVNTNFNNADKDHRLLIGSTTSEFTRPFSSTMSDSADQPFLPVSDQDTVMLYGVGGDRMPFNRADYFISNTSVPSFCAENTGVLYKASVDHGAGGPYVMLPILDCVADMKVVVGWDSSDTITGGASIYSSLPKVAGGTPDYFVGGSDPGLSGYFSSAKNIRERLKIVKVYILAQDGKRDANYQGPTSMVVGASPSEAGALPIVSNTYTFTAEQRKYRWKLYRLVIQPKNLLSNQK